MSAAHVAPPPTIPELGWTGTVGLLLIVAGLLVGIVLYHVWLERRVKTERDRAARP